jgi:hypothetical protein
MPQSRRINLSSLFTMYVSYTLRGEGATMSPEFSIRHIEDLAA